MQISSTKDAGGDAIKVLVYGAAGVGKTRLCATCPGKALILSAEAGLMSLRDYDIDSMVVKSVDELREAYHYLRDGEDDGKYDWVCIDSITEIAEVVLAHEKARAKDPRQAYGALIDQVTQLVRAFRDLPGRNVYMSAKMDRQKDDATGAMLYTPSMPGSKLGQQIPHFFDLVFCLRSDKDDEGKTVRWLQTQPCLQYSAKDRSGVLETQERADLTAITAKINER